MRESLNIEKTPTFTEIATIVNNFVPKTAEVMFFSEDGRIGAMPRVPSTLSEEELLSQGIKKFHLNPETLDGYSREEVVSAMRDNLEKDQLGGRGITGRTLKDIQEHLSGTEPYMQEAQGKIVFIGNGFSIAPLELLESDKDGKITELIVSDIFEYSTLLQDVTRLKQAFVDKSLKVPDMVANLYTTLESLVEAIKTEKIKFVKHVFGANTPPEQPAGANLVVNSYGPPEATAGEQLKMLAPGGTLISYLKPDLISISEEFTLIKGLGKPDEKSGSVIRRKVSDPNT